MQGEFRLRDISEAPEVNVLGWNEDWDFPLDCNFFDDSHYPFACQANDYDYYATPTHFLEFKIGDKWTHKFKMGEE